jgi:hypothetical protein
VIRLAGALLVKRHEEWLVPRRYRSAESMQRILAALRDETSSLEQQQENNGTRP